MAVVGKVKIIKSPKDYYDINDDVILVARNTHPDIVVSIDNVKGIVTEVENLVCHAAIISREFNKPLLMGVRNASRDFKTGDKVSVDFRKKSIRKIS